MMARTIDLMQVSHPGFSLYQMPTFDLEEHMPMYMEYVIVVCTRFKHYANMSQQVITMICLTDICDIMGQMSNTDDPIEIIPLRNELVASVNKFNELCEDMAAYIVNESMATDFYLRLGQKTKQHCYEYAGVEE